MACGKSTVGRQLAESLTWPFVDLDIVVEAQAFERWKTDIPGVFQRGEQVFRDLERECVDYLLTQVPHPYVLSLGGGTLHNGNLAEKIQENTSLFVLHASWSVVEDRIRTSNRPLKASAHDLFVQRDSGYKIGIGVTVDHRSVEDIVEEIRQNMLRLESSC